MNSSSTDQDLVDHVEVIDDLLEECWFYDNLLTRRSRVLRYCHSDPFPTCSSPSPKPKSTENPANLASEKTLEPSAGRCLTRAPSLPPCIERREEGEAAKKIKKLTRQLSERVRVQEPRPVSHFLLKKEDKGREGPRRNRDSSNPLSSSGGSLQRTRTLPSRIGRDDDSANDEFQDQESDSRLGFLIREALASSSGLTPPRQNVPKVSSIPRPPRNSRSEECIPVIIRPPNPTRKALRKTVSNLETEDIQRLKYLEMGSNSPDSDLRDKKPRDEEQRWLMMMSRAKRAVEPRAAEEATGRGRCGGEGPAIPKDRSRDMKAQIKFWARAVASNVRQEC